MNQLLIDLIDKFRELTGIPRQLTGIRRSIERQTRAIHEASEAAKQKAQSQPVIRAILEIPQPVTTHKVADNTNKPWLKKLEIAIQVATAFAVIYYACVAARQWREMQKQVKDFEAVQAAQLVIEDFKITGFPENVHVTFNLVNRGQTIAKQISLGVSGEEGDISTFDRRAASYPDMKVIASNLANIHPDALAGFSLGPGVGKPFDFRQGAVNKEVLTRQHGLSYYGGVAYRDIFGRVGFDSHCLVYSPASGGWQLCQVGRDWP